MKHADMVAAPGALQMIVSRGQESASRLLHVPPVVAPIVVVGVEVMGL